MNTITKEIMSQITFGDCWIWNGTKDNAGYGRLFVNGKHEKVSRIIYESMFGKKPETRRFRTCKNKQCVNPNHAKDTRPAKSFAYLGAKDLNELGEILNEKSKK
jgi:hypothetical protein